MITLASIVYKPKGAPAPRVGYLRQTATEAELVEGFGIAGDAKGGNPKRNLNVMDEITLAELAQDGYPKPEPGTYGENLILRGIDLRTLPEGTQLKIGPQAVIRLIALRDPCEQLTELDNRMPETVEGRVGYMCRVVASGPIKVGDEVLIEVPAQA
jgi:MOSC domain-containing protein YiiM